MGSATTNSRANRLPLTVSASATAQISGGGHGYALPRRQGGAAFSHTPFAFPVTRLNTSSAVVVMSTHKTAMAMPRDTLPCSNSRLM